MWQKFKQEAIWNYNLEFPNLHLHGFCDYDFKFIGDPGNRGNGCHINVHVLCIATCHVMWVVWNCHSFPNLELWWSSSLIMFAIKVFHWFIFVYMAKMFYLCGKNILSMWKNYSKNISLCLEKLGANVHNS